MKEVKSPKKPLLYYYGIVLLIIIVFNVLVTPMLTKTMVKEVDYGTFMSKIEERDRSATVTGCRLSADRSTSSDHLYCPGTVPEPQNDESDGR